MDTSRYEKSQIEAALLGGKIRSEDVPRALDVFRCWEREGHSLDLAEAIGQVASLSTTEIEEIRHRARNLVSQERSTRPAKGETRRNEPEPAAAPSIPARTHPGAPLRKVGLGLLCALSGGLFGWMAKTGALGWGRLVVRSDLDSHAEREPSPDDADGGGVRESNSSDSLDSEERATKAPPSELAGPRRDRRIRTIETRIESLIEELARLAPDHPHVCAFRGASRPPSSPAPPPGSVAMRGDWTQALAQADAWAREGKNHEAAQLYESLWRDAPESIASEAERAYIDLLDRLMEAGDSD